MGNIIWELLHLTGFVPRSGALLLWLDFRPHTWHHSGMHSALLLWLYVVWDAAFIELAELVWRDVSPLAK
jgi:hypothetical protein